jgi:hypothetical protein
LNWRIVAVFSADAEAAVAARQHANERGGPDHRNGRWETRCLSQYIVCDLLCCANSCGVRLPLAVFTRAVE